MALVALSVAVYAPSLGHDFVALDDDIYVTHNPFVHQGFSIEGLRRALFGGFDWNWHPLTWLSHMLDGQLYGLNAAGHHATNVALHAANTALLFHVLWRLGGAAPASALAAALFAVHPAHVEVVAWISARKDLLSTLFALCTILAYRRFVERPGKLRYAAVLALYAAGMLAKPMLVTLPVLLWLFDRWPLDAREPAPLSRRSILDKLPLLLVAVPFALNTLVVQKSVDALQSLDDMSLATRLSNAVVSYADYLRMLLWPADLGVMHVHPDAVGGHPLTPLRVLAAVAVLLSISAAVALSRRPYASSGWLWWIVSALPIIGLIQVGGQARADRYTYFTYLGLYVLVAWEAYGAVRHSARARVVAGGAAVALLSLLALRTREQLATWRDPRALFEQALAVNPDNVAIRYAYGIHLEEHDDLAGAERQLRHGLALKWDDADMQSRLGIALARQGKLDEAIPVFRAAVSLDPQSAPIRHNLALALWSRDPLAACAVWRQAAALDPAFEPARQALPRCPQ